MKSIFFNYAVRNTVNGLIHLLKLDVNEETGEARNDEVVCKSIRMRNDAYYERSPFDLSKVTCSRCYNSYSKHYKNL
jgi:hypothetical protein